MRVSIGTRTYNSIATSYQHLPTITERHTKLDIKKLPSDAGAPSATRGANWVPPWSGDRPGASLAHKKSAVCSRKKEGGREVMERREGASRRGGVGCGCK